MTNLAIGKAGLSQKTILANFKNPVWSSFNKTLLPKCAEHSYLNLFTNWITKCIFEVYFYLATLNKNSFLSHDHTYGFLNSIPNLHLYFRNNFKMELQYSEKCFKVKRNYISYRLCPVSSLLGSDCRDYLEATHFWNTRFCTELTRPFV